MYEFLALPAPVHARGRPRIRRAARPRGARRGHRHRLRGGRARHRAAWSGRPRCGSPASTATSATGWPPPRAVTGMPPRPPVAGRLGVRARRASGRAASATSATSPRSAPRWPPAFGYEGVNRGDDCGPAGGAGGRRARRPGPLRPAARPTRPARSRRASRASPRRAERRRRQLRPMPADGRDRLDRAGDDELTLQWAFAGAAHAAGRALAGRPRRAGLDWLVGNIARFTIVDVATGRFAGHGAAAPGRPAAGRRHRLRRAPGVPRPRLHRPGAAAARAVGVRTSPASPASNSARRPATSPRRRPPLAAGFEPDGVRDAPAAQPGRHASATRCGSY